MMIKINYTIELIENKWIYKLNFVKKIKHITISLIKKHDYNRHGFIQTYKNRYSDIKVTYTCLYNTKMKNEKCGKYITLEKLYREYKINNIIDK